VAPSADASEGSISLDRVVRSVSASEQSDESGTHPSIRRPPSPSNPRPDSRPGTRHQPSNPANHRSSAPGPHRGSRGTYGVVPRPEGPGEDGVLPGKQGVSGGRSPPLMHEQSAQSQPPPRTQSSVGGAHELGRAYTQGIHEEQKAAMEAGAPSVGCADTSPWEGEDCVVSSASMSPSESLSSKSLHAMVSGGRSPPLMHEQSAQSQPPPRTQCSVGGAHELGRVYTQDIHEEQKAAMEAEALRRLRRHLPLGGGGRCGAKC